MRQTITVESEHGLVREEDVQRMVAALEAFRGDRWWFDTETQELDNSRCLAPLVMQNMLLKLQAGTLDVSLKQVENILKTAIFYERKCREIGGENGK